MERRTAIRNISLGFGITVSAASFTTFLSGCKTDAVTSSTYSAMTDAQANMVENIMDVILPTTKTPGAKDLGIIKDVDIVVSKFMGESERERVKQSLDHLSDKISSDLGISIDKFDRDAAEKYIAQHYKTVKEKDPEYFSKDLDDMPEEEKAFRNTHDAIQGIKSMAISTYFRNKTIGMEYLNYDPVPGPYQGCVPLSEVKTVSAL